MKTRWFVALAGIASAALVAVQSPAPVGAITASSPVELTGPVGAGGTTGSPVLTPDGDRVVYRETLSTGSPFELWSVPVGGGTRVRLSGPLGAGGNVERFLLSPDGTTVVYVADQTTDGQYELHSVPVAGGPAVLLDAVSAYVAIYGIFAFTPDNGSVVYPADGAGTAGEELWISPSQGGVPQRLGPALPLGRAVVELEVSSDGARVAYVADENTDELFELFSVPTTGGASVRLNGNFPAGAYPTSFEFTPDSSTVVYIADQLVNDVQELWSVPADGGPSVRLNTPLGAGQDVLEFTIGPDGERVVYRADQAVDGTYELWSVPVGGGTIVRLNATLPTGGQATEFVVSPDASRVVYAAEQRTDSVSEMFSVSILGGTSVALHAPLALGRDAFTAQITSDSRTVVFMGDLSTAESFEVFSAPIQGGDTTRINAPLGLGRTVSTYWLSPNDHQVVYVADQDVDDRFDMYVGATDGPVPIRVAQAPTPGYFGNTLLFNPDGSMAVYQSVDATAAAVSIWSVGLVPDGASVFTPLAPTRVFDTRAAEPAPGPKGALVAGGSVDVQVTGVGGVPTNATAVVLNVTATESAGDGFVTVWPTGTVRPLASSINLTAASQTRPNLVITPVGTDGKVSMFSQRGTHLLADVTGYFTAATGPTTSGRILPLAPTRVFDTRPDEAAPGPKGYVAGGATISAQIAGVAGVPADATAVVLNVTATESAGDGYVTVWPTGQDRPSTSTLNLAQAGDTAANLVVMPLGDGGRIDLFVQRGAHLLADVTGYVTSAGASPDTSGLYVPLSPTRAFDTRESEPGNGPKGFVAGGSTINTTIARVAGVPAHVGLVSLNVTAIDAATGYVTAFPGPARPVASTVNLNGPNDVRANAAMVPLAGNGQLQLFSQTGAHLLADATGYTLA